MNARLPAFLIVPDRPWRAIALGWPTTTIPALLLSLLASTLAPNLARPEFEMEGWLALFLLVIFAPFFETLIMAAVLELLLRIMPKKWAVGVSALGWGAAHSLAAPVWGLVIWYVFLILSLLYVTWRERSLWWALFIPFAVHALNNLIPALLLVLRVG